MGSVDIASKGDNEMAKKTWLKGALIAALCGSLTAFGGCLSGFVQRILLAVQFD